MDFTDNINPYESPIVLAELVRPPKRPLSLAFRVLRSFVIAVVIFMVTFNGYLWLAWRAFQAAGGDAGR